MRLTAYNLFEIVAWPAAVWCAVEVALRATTQAYEGISATAVTGICAALTVLACRARSRQLAGSPVVAD